MTRGQRYITYAVASIGVLVLGWVVLIAGVYFFGGVATVSVVERSEGVDISLPIPMALVHAAVATTDVFFLDELLDEIEIETGTESSLSQWRPAALAILDTLDDAPNGTTFVAVEDGDDHVRVSKEWGKLRIEVDSPDVTVKIGLPVRSMRRIAAQIAS